MSQRAKLFNNGGSQAVRLPKACRFPEGQREVIAKRVGRKVILEPADEWPSDFADILGAWHEPLQRPRRRAIQELEDPFA